MVSTETEIGPGHFLLSLILLRVDLVNYGVFNKVTR